MKIHHLGYAVRNIGQARAAFETLGYFAAGGTFPDVPRNVNILFMKLGDTLVELIAPLDESRPSPVTQMAKKAPSTLYHPCYEVTDIAAAVRDLAAQGFRVIHDAAPAPAIGASAVVAFLHSPQTGVIELCQL
jgi:methylmalonyl-CoA/ethylmalonyl-CoA epimerase